MSLCRDGGACCLHKEDDLELCTGAIVTDLVAVGSVPAELIKGIDRYLNKARRHICLSVKDGSS